jgi:LysR family transcriptional regulator, low CO2-responsive transcriptional regulator
MHTVVGGANTMDLHKLKLFVTVARYGTFTKAADILDISQPTISQQIALLETQIGAPLIDRQRRQQKLTAAGQALLPLAERLLVLAEDAVQEARAAAGQYDRTLRLGVGHTLATYLLPDVLRRYRDSYPSNPVQISVGNTATLLGQVANGVAELALVGTPAEHPDIEIEEFRRDRLVVIVAPDDLWARRSQVGVAELLDRTLLIREPGSALHASLGQLVGHEALVGEHVIVLAETEAIKRCVEAGVGVAVVQGIAVEREVTQGMLRALTLHGGDDQRRYVIARRKRSALSQAARALVAVVK